jgi:arsenite methyltransferase
MSVDYMSGDFDLDDPELVSAIDELPLWSAPFGLKILDMVKLGKGIKLLDIGCGAGFPALEIAQRLDLDSRVYGIDNWQIAVERANQKIKFCNIRNAEIINASAENLPFENESIDIIVSNNGLNNVDNIEQVLIECYRVLKTNGQLLFSMNLEKTMIEFYDVFKNVLLNHKMNTEVKKITEHIFEKRKPVEYMENILGKYKFGVSKIENNEFSFRFTDGSAMFRHFLIRLGFLKSWKQIIPPNKQSDIFSEIENELNKIASEKGELKLTIPFAVFDCLKT